MRDKGCQVSSLQIFRILLLAVCFIWIPSIAPTAGVPPVAVFPLQELGKGGRYDANLPLTSILADHLAYNGNDIIGLNSVIPFMANNRIRIVGYLERFHFVKVLSDLGAPLVLLGTVSRRKEKPEPSIELTLNLVRTSDARSIWTYVGSLSFGQERRFLGIGEPRTIVDLVSLLLDEITELWPWELIYEAQQAELINIDNAVVQPRYVRTGAEVHGKVRLRNKLYDEQPTQVFFKVKDRLYPATISADGSTYNATWVAEKENGRFPVTLLLEWPIYGRTQTALLGSYLVDNTPPLFELKFGGTRDIDEVPVFSGKLTIIPHMLVRKPISRWNLAFYYEDGGLAGSLKGDGNLPESFTWAGITQLDGILSNAADGIYTVEVEAWDLAGNSAKAAKLVRVLRSWPLVELSATQTDEGLVVDLINEGKVPLDFWRLDIWTQEGKILSQAEGKKLPSTINIKLSDMDLDQKIEGFLYYQDVMGKKNRKRVKDLLPKTDEQAGTEIKDDKPAGISESWVNEF